MGRSLRYLLATLLTLGALTVGYKGVLVAFSQVPKHVSETWKQAPEAPVAYPPIILVHGFLGTSLDVRFDNTETACSAPGSWSKFWLSVPLILRHGTCVRDAIAPDCDPRDQDSLGLPRCHHRGEVVTRPGGGFYGTLEAMRYVTQPRFDNIEVSYFAATERALRAAGWTGSGEDVFGHVYNWLLAPASWVQDTPWPNGEIEDEGNDFSRLKNLVESAHTKTGLPAILLAHSFGAISVHAFLTQMPADWVAEHVGGVLNVAPAFAGTPAAAAEVVAAVPSFGYLPSPIMRPLNTRLPMMHALAPDDRFWPYDEAPLLLDGDPKSVRDLPDIVAQYYGSDRATVHQQIREAIRPLTPPESLPQVRSYWLVGNGHSTARQYAVNGLHLEGEPTGDNVASSMFGAVRKAAFAPGDGTLLSEPIVSVFRQTWAAALQAGHDPDRLRLFLTPNGKHMTLVSDDRIVKDELLPVLYQLIKDIVSD